MFVAIIYFLFYPFSYLKIIQSHVQEEQKAFPILEAVIIDSSLLACILPKVRFGVTSLPIIEIRNLSY
jgi:hypothetical protein